MATFRQTTLRDVSNEWEDHVCTTKCDNGTEYVFVTTRRGTNKAPGSNITTEESTTNEMGNVSHDVRGQKQPETLPDDVEKDDFDDDDVFDLDLARCRIRRPHGTSHAE